jgi:hypothetical protein
MYSYDRRAAGKVFYHGSPSPDIQQFKAGGGTFGLMGTGVYFYAKADVAKQYYGPYVYRVEVPSGIKVMPEKFEFTLENVQTILRDLGVDSPQSLNSLPGGVVKPLWWFTDGWNYFNQGRAKTAEQVAMFLSANKGFDGMLATYPKGGKVLVLWKKYDRLRPELVE